MSPGDVVIGHEAAFYRDGSLTASQRPRPVVPGYEVPQAAPAEAPLPMTGVARAVAGKEVNRLRAQVEGGRRDLAARFTFGVQGQQISDPAMLAMRAELVAQIDAAAAEADRLNGLDDLAVRQWAHSRGVR